MTDTNTTGTSTGGSSADVGRACTHPATHYSPQTGLICAICGSDTPGLKVERPPLIGLWALEAIAGAAALLVASCVLVLVLRDSAGAVAVAVNAAAAAGGVALLCHAVAVARARASLRAMSDSELREVAARARAIEQRHHDVYEPKHSH